MKLTTEGGVAAGVFAAEGLAAAAIQQFGAAGRVPMHFGLNGQVDRWGDRTEAAIMAAAIAVGAAALYVLLPLLARRRRPDGGRAEPVARAIILIMSLALTLLAAALGFGLMNQHSPLPILTGLFSVMMLAMGVYIGKVEPNPIAGVRTYWSLRSRLAWDKSNRLFGRVAFWIGATGLVAFPFAPQPLGFQLLIGGLILGALAAVFESWRVWRSDPDRSVA